MKFSLRKILAFAFLFALPLVLFLVLRAQASWRPQRVAGATYHGLIAFSPDGKRFANASRDGHELISLYDVATNREVARHDFGDHISAMSFSPDGSTLAVTWSGNGGGNGMGGWNFEQEKFTFKRARDYACHRLRFSPDGRMLWLVSSYDVRNYGLSSGHIKWCLPKDRQSERSSFKALSRDGRFCFGFDQSGEVRMDGSGDGDYHVWSIAQKKLILRVKLPSPSDYISLYDDGRYFFPPDATLLIYLGDMPSGAFYFIVETRTGRILWRAPQDSSARFVGDKVALRKADKFEICDARTGKVERRLSALPKTTPISSPSNDWLYCVDEDGGLFRQRLR